MQKLALVPIVLIAVAGMAFSMLNVFHPDTAITRDLGRDFVGLEIVLMLFYVHWLRTTKLPPGPPR
ncbi:MAG: hypothetical protein JWQ32_593 [Marmoricola sp.]|nr:hypothetical protein [Marmoricola sp.]